MYVQSPSRASPSTHCSMKNLVKLETRSRVGKTVRPLSSKEQNQILQDLGPLLAEKGVPPVNETVGQWAIKRLQISDLRDEQSMHCERGEVRDVANERARGGGEVEETMVRPNYSASSRPHGAVEQTSSG
jgi:hypothetical protein